MNASSLPQYALFLGLMLVLVRPVGRYLQRVFDGERTILDPLLRPLERATYRLAGIDPRTRWRGSSTPRRSSCSAWLGRSCSTRSSAYSPSSPASTRRGLARVTPDLAMNTAVSFATTTTWQAYAGETTMQLLHPDGRAGGAELPGGGRRAGGRHGLHSRLRARRTRVARQLLGGRGAGAAVGAPPGLAGGQPGARLAGRAAELHAYPDVVGDRRASGQAVAQVIAQGPVAALEPIKNLGTNGGGFFNVNGAHPFENPTPLTNFLEMLAIAVLPAALHTPSAGWSAGPARAGCCSG